MLLLQISFAQQDSLQQKTSPSKDSVFVMQKSPWGSVLRSAIIPGWGQIYNHSYIEAPVIWGITGWLVYEWIQSNNLYKQSIDLYNQTKNSDYLSYKNFYQDQRDLFAIYIGLAYVLNLVDAYVDAELFDFTVKENSYTRSPMLNMRIKF
jgi:Family of unknown function (DUF5683)